MKHLILTAITLGALALAACSHRDRSSSTYQSTTRSSTGYSK